MSGHQRVATPTDKPKPKKKPKKKVKKPEYASKAGLKYRGWTEKSIELFLGESDKEADNPHYKCAAPCQLYLLSRVARVEKTKGYQKFLSASTSRKESRKRAIESRKDQWLSFAQNCVISFANIYENVVANALADYEAFSDAFMCFHVKNSKDSLEHIVVCHLRYQFAPYDAELEAFAGEEGETEVRKLLNKRIYSEIAYAFPQLKQECERQFFRRYNAELITMQ